MTPEIATRFWCKVDRSAGLFACWPWLGAFNRPSELFQRRHQGGISRRPTFHPTPKTIVYAQRLALALTDGVPLEERKGLEACHTRECGHYWCCNPVHLYWGTPDQNRGDRYRREPTADELRARLGSLTG